METLFLILIAFAIGMSIGWVSNKLTELKHKRDINRLRELKRRLIEFGDGQFPGDANDE